VHVVHVPQSQTSNIKHHKIQAEQCFKSGL
jgi:hypothetical protein